MADGTRCGLPGGGKDLDSRYQVKHFTRCMLAVAEHLTPGILDNFKLEDMFAWCPDNLERLTAVLDLTCSQAKQMFGVPGYMLSCWVCLADSIMGHLKRREPKKHAHGELALAVENDSWVALHNVCEALLRHMDCNWPLLPGMTWEVSRQRKMKRKRGRARSSSQADRGCTSCVRLHAPVLTLCGHRPP